MGDIQSQLTIVDRIDKAIAARKGTAAGEGCVECPLCKNRVDYVFKRGKRLVVRFACRTDGCLRGMT